MKIDKPSPISRSKPGPSDHRTLLLMVLFVSGFCSLVYQIVWLREFRLLFGASTPAVSAVLATFMGGLGIGGAFFGRRVERCQRPARFYSLIELGIAASTLLSPLLLLLGRKVYLLTGGTLVLGGWGASLVQTGLTALVIGIPCFLMGGTLPAALSYAQSNDDVRRMTTSLFYGANVVGAMAGAFLANFVFLNLFGNRVTLAFAVIVNFAIGAMVLVMIAKNETLRIPGRPEETRKDVDGRSPGGEDPGRVPARLIYLVAFVSGFVFFVAELVWYRISIPLLGGSVYNFGLILAIVLGGMGLGGVVYSLLLRVVRPTPTLVAGISLLMSLSLVLPFVCGDWFAYFTLALQSSTMGFPFSDKIISWSLITAALVFPTALFAGMQFPALISLIGRGQHGVARQLGNTYAWNTFGAILGALLGGFVFIPVFSLVETWRWIAIFSLLLAGLMLLPHGRAVSSSGQGEERVGKVLLAMGLAGVFLLGFTSLGPQAFWTQSAIGFGRIDMPSKRSKAGVLELFRTANRKVVSAFDGREASVAITGGTDLALLTNGKSDGSAHGDAGTQVMLPLIPALLHPGEVKNTCVIGLGTGTSAGWLGSVPSVEKVDVIELEPKLFKHIAPFDPVNRNCLANPKVNPIVGDAREVLMVKRESYDVIASEPSNPHRAGVANLYTREFYRAVSDRLAPQGIFAQWLQAYEIDNETMSLIITTLSSVFPRVEIFQTLQSDLVFVCSNNEEPWDLDLIRTRIKQDPFEAALAYTWGVHSAEGFFCRCIGNNNIVREISEAYFLVNSDQHNRLEFALGGTVGKRILESPYDNIWQLAVGKKWTLPPLTGKLDQQRMKRDMIATMTIINSDPEQIFAGSDWLGKKDLERYATLRMSPSKPKEFLEKWDFDPQNWIETHRELKALALAGDKRFHERLKRLGDRWPIDKAALSLIYYDVSGDQQGAREMVAEMFQALHDHTWCHTGNVRLALNHASKILSGVDAEKEGEWLKEIFSLLSVPFQTLFEENRRRSFLTVVAEKLSAQYRLQAIEEWGEYYPFTIKFLELRVKTFKELSDPRLAGAVAELERCRRWQ